MSDVFALQLVINIHCSLICYVVSGQFKAHDLKVCTDVALPVCCMWM